MLKSLHLGYSNIVDHDLKMIGTLCGKTITSLDVSGCMNITDTGIQWLAKFCTSLEKLYLYE